MRNILFDLDGTISDPKEGFIGSISYTLSELGLTTPDEHILHSRIGPPLRDTLSFLLDTADSEKIEHATSLYRAHFGTIGKLQCALYDTIAETIATLYDQECKLYLATSKLESFAIDILEHFELRKYFTGVYGTQPDAVHDDKSELVRHLLEKEGISDAMIIGDRKFDILAGRANNIMTIGALWGYGTEEELREAGADRVISQPSELFADLLNFLF